MMQEDTEVDRRFVRQHMALMFARATPVFSAEMIAGHIGCHLFSAQAILTRMLRQGIIRCYDQTSGPNRIYYGAYGNPVNGGTSGKTSAS
jgi:hypothetical protein